MARFWALELIALIFVSALFGIGPALAGAAPRVILEGTELRLIDGAGRIRSGEALIGSELTLVDAYGERRLRIEHTMRDSGDPARAIRLYAFSIWTPPPAHGANCAAQARVD